MKRIDSDVVGGLFWVAVGILSGIGAVLLGVGTLKSPGPGFLPVIMAALLVIFSLATIVYGWRGLEKPLIPIAWRKQAFVIAMVVVYSELLELLGFLLSTLILMSALFGLLFETRHRLRNVLICAVITAAAAWLVFVVVAKMPFPEARLFGLG